MQRAHREKVAAAKEQKKEKEEAVQATASNVRASVQGRPQAEG